MLQSDMGSWQDSSLGLECWKSSSSCPLPVNRCISTSHTGGLDFQCILSINLVIIICCKVIKTVWLAHHCAWKPVVLSMCTINTMQRHNAAPGASTTSRAAASKQSRPSWVTACQAPFILALYLQMVSGRCVDTELCKSTCLQCGLNRSMCWFGDLFEVLWKLPVQPAESDVAQPSACLTSPGLGVCSLQQSGSCNTH